VTSEDIITAIAMADQINEKPEVEATASGAQEVPAAEKPTEPSSIGNDAAKADGEANKEDTKTAEGKL
jgi:hypothetical protein